MPATTEVLPAGNEWKFSARNFPYQLRPGLGVREIVKPNPLLQKVVQYVQECFIVEGWQLAALVKNLPTRGDHRQHLIAVFTNPLRVDLIESWEHDIREFIKPDAVRSDFNPPASDPFWGRFKADDPINEILRGTNFVAKGIMVEHNGIRVGQKTFWQTGVGLFDIDLSTYKQIVFGIDHQLEDLMKQVRPLQERKAALVALQSPHPVPLFQTGI